MRAHLVRQVMFNAWANSKMLIKLKQIESQSGYIMDTFSHILASEKVWVARVRGLDTSGIEIWPKLTVSQIEQWSLENRQMLNELNSYLSELDFDNLITYKNSKGITYHESIKDIMTHLVMHGTYHRGQIARTMRQQEIDPPNTDYITFVREGG